MRFDLLILTQNQLGAMCLTWSRADRPIPVSHAGISGMGHSGMLFILSYFRFLTNQVHMCWLLLRGGRLCGHRQKPHPEPTEATRMLGAHRTLLRTAEGAGTTGSLSLPSSSSSPPSLPPRGC